MRLSRGWLAAAAPSRRLVSSTPCLFRVAQPLLDFFHRCLVASVLAHIVADLDSMPTQRRSNLDHNVERHRLVAR